MIHKCPNNLLIDNDRLLLYRCKIWEPCRWTIFPFKERTSLGRSLTRFGRLQGLVCRGEGRRHSPCCAKTPTYMAVVHDVFVLTMSLPIDCWYLGGHLNILECWLAITSKLGVVGGK